MAGGLIGVMATIMETMGLMGDQEVAEAPAEAEAAPGGLGYQVKEMRVVLERALLEIWGAVAVAKEQLVKLQLDLVLAATVV